MGAHADNRRAALREAVMAAAKSVTAGKPKLNRQARRALARSKAAHPANKSTAQRNIAALEAALKKAR